MNIDLNEQEANQLIKNKKYINLNFYDINKKFIYPVNGGILEIDVIDDYKNDYIIGVRQRRIELIKRSHILRYAKSIVLVRVDFDREHRNPDGEHVGVPHVHIYKDGFNDKYAYPLQRIGIELKNKFDIKELLNQFLNYVNATDLRIDTRYQAEVFDYDE